MKALSLWQPWASLIAWGDKRYETRSWTTTYRGPLAMHAAKHPFPQDWEDLLGSEFYREAFERKGVKIQELPVGMVLCVVDLVDVLDTERLIIQGIRQAEQYFGDYSRGRFAWRLENLRVLVEPIPARDAQ